MNTTKPSWWRRRSGWLVSRLAAGGMLFQMTGMGGCGDQEIRAIASDFTSGIIQAVVNQFINDLIGQAFNAAGLTA